MALILTQIIAATLRAPFEKVASTLPQLSRHSELPRMRDPPPRPRT
jgi:hypothetical protein